MINKFGIFFWHKIESASIKIRQIGSIMHRIFICLKKRRAKLFKGHDKNEVHFEDNTLKTDNETF